MITLNDLKKYTEELSKKITFNTENVYEHTLSLRGGSAYNKFVATIYTTSAIPMISADIKAYVRKNASSAGSSNPANNAYIIPCNGMVGSSSTNCVVALGMYYNTTSSTYCVAQQTGAGLTEYALSDLTVQKDVVRTIALNNVLRPSIQEYTTNLNYNGSKIADIKWTLLKTPMPNNKFLYKWNASGSGNVSVAWTVWSSSVTWSYCSSMVSAVFPSGYGSKIQDSIVYDLDITNVSCSCCKNTTTSGANCYFERPTGYDTATRTIKFKAQAEYIDN